MKKLQWMLVLVCGLFGGQGPGWAKEQQNAVLPAFDELYNLVRSKAVGITQAEANEAAVMGLLEQLRSKVWLVTNTPAATAGPLVEKSDAFEDAYGYVRIGNVESGLAERIREAYGLLRLTNELKGLVIDLRFASGYNYREAAAVADLFLSSELPLLQLGGETLRSRAKQDPIPVPVALLVNEATGGAAEALAAVMRDAVAAIVIGNKTAGEARAFEEFTLSNGQRVKVATSLVRLADGTPVPEQGLQPDIRVAISLDEEKAYLADPYRNRGLAEGLQNGDESLLNTNRVRRPRNESELIRMRQEGLDSEPVTEQPQVDAVRALNDPVLARAIDFLKGLALVRNRR